MTGRLTWKIIILLFAFLFGESIIPVNKSINNNYQIVKVIDGDTVIVDINGKNKTIRLIGINSPELKDPRKPVECFAKEASKKAKEVLTDKIVKLENDPTQGDKDKYGRLLRYIFLENGTNFNKLMIEEGYAHEYTYNLPYKYQKEFIQAQLEAEKNEKGLWNKKACSPNGKE